MLFHRSEYMRAAVIRTMRHLLIDPNFSQILWKNQCHYFLFKFFEIPDSNKKEKKQLFEFIQTILKRDSDINILPTQIVRGLVYIAEIPEDPYNKTSLEMLKFLCKFYFKY
jgi:hypothetical protein